jgi:DNA polymerase-3 subunit delta
VAELAPAYLVSGEDDVKIDAWRARVRARAEDERGPGGLELFEARASDPEEVAAALATLTFATGTRYLLVEDAGAWKAAQLSPLEAALADMAPETVLVLIVRGKALKQLAKVVEKAGGEVREYPAPKPWELPKWVLERAREEGLQLEQEAAKELVTLVGQSQQRLSREIEKLAIALHPGTRITPEDVVRLASGDTAPQVYDLADALVAGDLRAALALAEELKAHDARPGGLIYGIVRRLREVHGAAALLDADVPEQQVGEAVDKRPWLAKRIVAKAKKADRAALERALCVLSELELDLRGGGHSALDESTAFSLALARAAPQMPGGKTTFSQSVTPSSA